MDIEKIVSKYIKTYLSFRGINYTDRQIEMNFNYNSKIVDIEVYTSLRNFKQCVSVSFIDFMDWVELVERKKKLNKILKNG